MKYEINGVIYDTLIEAQEAKDLMFVVTIRAIADFFIVGNKIEEYRYTTQAEADNKKLFLESKVYPDVIISEVLPIDYEGRFYKDLDFGKILINTFLIDNRFTNPPITPTQSLELLQKFQVVSALCDKGDIKSVSAIFPSIEIDAIYTQERKDKYVVMITTHLLYL